MRRALLVALFIVGAALPVAAQDGVYETLSVESTSADALDVAGGLELGVDLSAENGGVPETAVILINGTSCPGPARSVPCDDSGARDPHRLPLCSGRRVTAGSGPARKCDIAMRDKLKGAVLGALVAACATVLLAQTPPWTAPITWTTGDLLTASQFNAQFRDNLLNLRGFAACAETGITGHGQRGYGPVRRLPVGRHPSHDGGRAGHGRHDDHGDDVSDVWAIGVFSGD